MATCTAKTDGAGAASQGDIKPESDAAVGTGGEGGGDVSEPAGGGGATPDAGVPDPPPELVVAYTDSVAKKGFTADVLQNSGHQFEVTEEGIVIHQLGFWDSGADGLSAAHTVALFALDKAGLGATATLVAGGSVSVPAGVAAPLESGFRFAPLAAPVALAPGHYAVVAYGFNGADPYGDGGNVPFSGTGIVDSNFDVYRLTGDTSVAYPTLGDGNDHASASFLYETPHPSFLKIMPLGASITEGVGSTGGGYRKPLHQLLNEHGVAHQFVGSMANNTGNLELDQLHHEGHSGWVIIGGTSGRAGVFDSIGTWLGPSGVDPDLFLVLLGTNDVDLNYMLADAPNRMDQLLTAILDAEHGLKPGARLILAQLPPIMDATEDARMVTYNAGLVAVVDRHKALGERVSLVDMHSILTSSDMSDKLHPNDGGHAKLAQAWLDAILSP